METHAGSWEFDPTDLQIRNKATGESIPLCDMDTPEAVLQETLRIGSRDRQAVRGFTAALRQACSVVFQSNLRDVYCGPGLSHRVNWQRCQGRNRS